MLEVYLFLYIMAYFVGWGGEIESKKAKVRLTGELLSSIGEFITIGIAALTPQQGCVVLVQ